MRLSNPSNQGVSVDFVGVVSRACCLVITTATVVTALLIIANCIPKEHERFKLPVMALIGVAPICVILSALKLQSVLSQRISEPQ